MSKSDTQGRAYEYACLMALADGISQYRDVVIIENNPLAHARDCYFTIDPGVQELYDISASAMIDKLFDCEPMIIESASKPGTQHIVEMYLDNGWAFSFRIHNASTKVEPSLKFDIQMISVPIAIMTINCVW